MAKQNNLLVLLGLSLSGLYLAGSPFLLLKRRSQVFLVQTFSAKFFSISQGDGF
jgi:hypothetical protein